MRRLLAALLLILLRAGPAPAALAVVQTASCSASGATTCTTGAITTTSGTLLVGSTGYCCAAFTSITDSQSNTWTSAIAELASSSTLGQARYAAIGTRGSGHTFTLTGASGSFYGTLSVTEISGASATPLDQTATGSGDAGGGTTARTTANTATTAQATELLLGFGTSFNQTTYTTDTGAGWIELTNVATDASTEGLLTGYRIVSATGAYAYTFSLAFTGPFTVQGIMTWREAIAAGGRQRCLGCGVDGKVIE